MARVRAPLNGLRQPDTLRPVALALVLALLTQLFLVAPLALAMAAEPELAICHPTGAAGDGNQAPPAHDHSQCLICHSATLLPPPAIPAVLAPPGAIRALPSGQCPAPVPPPLPAAAYGARAPPARA